VSVLSEHDVITVCWCWSPSATKFLLLTLRICALVDFNKIYGGSSEGKFKWLMIMWLKNLHCLWLYRRNSSPTTYRVQNWNTAATDFKAEYEMEPAARWLITHNTLSTVREMPHLWRDLCGKLAGQGCG